MTRTWGSTSTSRNLLAPRGPSPPRRWCYATHMKFGAVLPHNEIGTDPGAIAAYLQGLEELGVANLLAYDHVLGADPDRPGGWSGPYDKDVAFHEPLTFFAWAA